ncbi:MAG: transposase [Selenomonadaceae bacterium]|nr:transposase [Selenomonadaceae bacterium]
MKNILGLYVDISPKIKAEGFQVIPKRWVVERTFAWIKISRRMSKDYEILTSTEEAIIQISNFHLLLRRL